MNRPHAYILKDTKIRFPKPPLRYNFKIIIPNINFPIPLDSGKICYLIMPANYSKAEFRMVLNVVKCYFEELKIVQLEEEKSYLKEYSKKACKKSIIQTHY